MNIWLLVLFNTLVALTYLFVNRKRRQRILALFFLLLPVLGFVMYFIPLHWFRVTQKHNLYDESNVRLNIKQEDFARRPDLVEEINEVAFSEAATVASSQEKRALLMGILRNDLMQNRNLIQSALDDDDTETAHYAASASIEINRRLKSTVQARETAYRQNQQDLNVLRSLIESVDQLLELALLSAREQYFYQNKAIGLYTDLAKLDARQLAETDYLHWSQALMATQSPHEALNIARQGNERLASEATWLNLLQLLHRLRDREAFEQAMQEFLSQKLVVSEKGLNLIRFWQERAV